MHCKVMPQHRCKVRYLPTQAFSTLLQVHSRISPGFSQAAVQFCQEVGAQARWPVQGAPHVDHGSEGVGREAGAQARLPVQGTAVWTCARSITVESFECRQVRPEGQGQVLASSRQTFGNPWQEPSVDAGIQVSDHCRRACPRQL